LLALQALSRDLLCGDNDLLSCIANFYARCLFRLPDWGRWIICRWNMVLGSELAERLTGSGRHALERTRRFPGQPNIVVQNMPGAPLPAKSMTVSPSASPTWNTKGPSRPLPDHSAVEI
jgi:hypothetical protein